MATKSGARKNAAIQHVAFGNVDWDMGPFGLIQYAQDFAEAARRLPTPKDFAPARYYMACHAIELGLKAFLALQGQPVAELIDAYGHNIEKAMTDAVTKGLLATVPLSKVQHSTIVKASRYYNDKVFEYPALPEAVKGYPDRPVAHFLMSAAELLVEHLYVPCRDWANR